MPFGIGEQWVKAEGVVVATRDHEYGRDEYVIEVHPQLESRPRSSAAASSHRADSVSNFVPSSTNAATSAKSVSLPSTVAGLYSMAPLAEKSSSEMRMP